MRNFGAMGLEAYSTESLSCPSGRKSGAAWLTADGDKQRYAGFLVDLRDALKAARKDRRASSTDTVRHYVLYGYSPEQGLKCARYKRRQAEWMPPNFEEYLAVWNAYGDQRQVVQHFYDGRGSLPDRHTSGAAVQHLVQQMMADTSSGQTNAYREGRYDFDLKAHGSAQSAPRMPTPGPPTLGPPPGAMTLDRDPVALPEDATKRTRVSSGLKWGLALGALGVGAFVARRQGWI